MSRWSGPSESGITPVAAAWGDKKLVLHKLRFHADFVAPFSPPCEGG